MKKTFLIFTLISSFLLFFSCKISTKNINHEENGFFFKTKSKYFKINDENYQISFPKNMSGEEKLTVKFKPQNGKKTEKIITQKEYLKVEEILKRNNPLSEENKKEIQKILKITY